MDFNAEMRFLIEKIAALEKEQLLIKENLQKNMELNNELIVFVKALRNDAGLFHFEKTNITE